MIESIFLGGSQLDSNFILCIRPVRRFLFSLILPPLIGYSSVQRANAGENSNWPPPLDPINQKLNSFNEIGNYLGPTKLLQNEVAKGESEKQLWTQTLSFYLSCAGLYAESIEAMHAAWPKPMPNQISEQAKMQFLSAVDLREAKKAICSEVSSHQIVIINENHHHPQHRRFGKNLLPCFKQAGFTHFALETIGEESREINKRGHVSRKITGYYTAEPQMAALVNEGLRLGFKIVRYETRNTCNGCTTEDSIDQREEDQANNLIAETFNNEPKAKVLIWVGYAHAYKRQLTSSPKSRWMATRLWEKTGIEPFSIEQLSEQLEWNETQPAFEAINSKRRIQSPAYFDLKSWSAIPEEFKIGLRKTQKDGAPAIDAVVVHPAQSSTEARHLWLGASAKLVLPVYLKAQKTRSEFLIQIFSKNLKKEELSDAVPIDQTICGAGADCELVAPAGRYWFQVWDQENILKSGQRGFNRRTNLIAL